MKKTRTALLLAVGLIAGNAHAANEVLTCGDVINSKNPASLDPEIDRFREIGFKFAAWQMADEFYEDLEKKSVVNRLHSTVDLYAEQAYPNKELSEQIWQLSVKETGTQELIAKLCGDNKSMQIPELFKRFYFKVYVESSKRQ
ncbi:hypothetical protein [Xanthomonas axonopodis]